jgi:hypothetical protein
VPRKSISKNEIASPNVPGRAQPLLLFGPPLLIEGEDAAAYDQLLARIWAAVKPVDIIDEMLIADVVFLEWEVLRWRRLKWTLMRTHGLGKLEGFLARKLEYDSYSEHFTDYLTEILRDNLPEEEADSAPTLARKCARNERDAVDKINEVLAGIDREMEQILSRAQDRKAEELVRDYVRREPDAVTLVHELLTSAGTSMDNFLVDALALKLDDIERIDRLITVAESRRNASLHEIDRRRTILGQTLRRSIQEIEDGKVIESMPANRKNAA